MATKHNKFEKFKRIAKYTHVQKGKSDCIKHFTKSVSSIYNKCYSNLRLYLTKRLMKINKTNIHMC